MVTATRAAEVFPGTATSVRDARAWVAARLAEVPELSPETVSDAELIISELATNAVRYTRSGDPGGSYTVAIDADSWQVTIRVIDQGADTIPLARTPKFFEESGRGLRMVEHVADYCGPVVTEQGSGYLAAIRTCGWKATP